MYWRLKNYFYHLVPTEDNVDSRKHKGVVTKVKYYGQYGSCRAFSTIGAIEFFYANDDYFLEKYLSVKIDEN